MTVFLLCAIIKPKIKIREENALNTTCEYIIRKKNEGGTLIRKIAVAISYFLLAAILISLVLIFSPYVFIIPFILIALAFVALIYFATWRFLSVEYEIVIAGGDLTVTTIYGRSLSKRTVNVSISSIIEIGEYGDGAYEEISKLSLQKNYICVSSLASPDMYYAIFDEDKDRSILYFDATSEAIALLKRHNGGAFRASEKRMNNK